MGEEYILTTEKKLRQAKMLKHSLILSIAHLSMTKKPTKELKTALTKAKRIVTKLEKKMKA